MWLSDLEVGVDAAKGDCKDRVPCHGMNINAGHQKTYPRNRITTTLRGDAAFIGLEKGGGLALPNFDNQHSFLDLGTNMWIFDKWEGASGGFSFAMWVRFDSFLKDSYLLYLRDDPREEKSTMAVLSNMGTSRKAKWHVRTSSSGSTSLPYRTCKESVRS